MVMQGVSDVSSPTVHEMILFFCRPLLQEKLTSRLTWNRPLKSVRKTDENIVRFGFEALTAGKMEISLC
jgi:hypothetical protein